VGVFREGKIADIFDALTAVDPPYRRAISREKGGEILKAEAKAGRLDKDLVNLFLDKKLSNFRLGNCICFIQKNSKISALS
jgi:HD-GYP domain-containing protein (c-di-GMP phosphodiesterase class II)